MGHACFNMTLEIGIVITLNFRYIKQGGIQKK